MKVTYILAALVGLAVAAPSPAPESFNVDLSGLVDDGLQARSGGDGCPSQQTCIGHRCVMLVCSPITRTTTCITYKYGKC
jgi:hypothetical protein